MSDDQEGTDTQKALFVNLIMMLSSSAMQQLGLLVDPMTNKSEVNLEGAQVSIDMLEMLRVKSQGNLDSDEEKMMSDVLSSLQMNYVAVSQQRPEEEGAAPDQQEDASSEPEGEQPEEPKVESGGPDSDPKFHKSYG